MSTDRRKIKDKFWNNSENDSKFLFKELSYRVIGLAMEVHRELGTGFLEKVYENALMIQCRDNNIEAVFQKPLKVFFKGEIVGDYIADVVIEDKILLELKSVETITDSHRGKIVNYLKATKLKIGYIINFGGKNLEYERFVNIL